MGIQFPTWGKAGDWFNAGPYKFEHDGIGWKRRFVRYEELVQQADAAAIAAASAATEAATAQAAADKAAAEQAKADALAAQAAAEAAATQSSAAAVTAVGALTDNAPAEYDTFAEVAAAMLNKADKHPGIVTITASTTLSPATHADKIIYVNTTGAVTLTIPNDAEFVIGTEIAVVRKGSGTVLFSPSGVNLYSGESKRYIKNQYASAALIKTAATEWMLAGSLE